MINSAFASKAWTRNLSTWRGSSYKDLCDMLAGVRQTFGFALGLAQNGLPYEDAKTLSG